MGRYTPTAPQEPTGGRGPGEPSNPIIGLALGALVGAVGGLAFAGWEAALLGWAGLALPGPELGGPTLVVYAVTGAVIGGVAGLVGARGAGFAWAVAAMAAAWLASGKLGLYLEGSGAPAWVSLTFVLPAGAIAAVFFPKFLGERRGLLFGLAAALLATLALALPINLHLVGSPTSGAALAVDALLLIPACVAGAGAALLMGPKDNSLAVAAATLAALVLGWATAWPVLETPEPAWPQAERDGRPVVLVVVDTLRADHLGVYGYNRPTSPHIDARAALVYRNAASTAPWTLPSMGSLLTGRHVHHHGAGVNTGSRNLKTSLAGEATTVAEVLSRNGYATAAVVTNPWVVRSFGMHRGFSTYDDDVGPAALPVGLHPLQVLRVDPVGWPAYRDAATLTDRALSFVQAQSHGAWFLMVHYMDVHGPRDPPDEDREAVGARGDTVLDAYDASIHLVDRHLGRLLEALPRNAVVVLVSDHGEELAERRKPTSPLPPGVRHGHTLYQEQLHVPLILWGPGIPRRTIDRPVSLVDVAPTLLHIAGVNERPRGLDGDVLPEISGQPRPEKPTPILSMGLHYGAEQQAVRVAEHKLVFHASGAVAIYDLEADPAEKNPMAHHNPVRNDVESRLRALLPAVGVVGAEVSVEAEMGDLLQRLGYRE